MAHGHAAAGARVTQWQGQPGGKPQATLGLHVFLTDTTAARPMQIFYACGTHVPCSEA